jgi:Spy/CpxP family protein refolding chaperone
MAITMHILHMRMRGSQDMANMDHSSMDHSSMMDHEAHKAMTAEGAGQSHPGQMQSTDMPSQFRSIKSLTSEELAAYQQGTGHGMAKAAEQNDHPGPRHVLAKANELQLTDEQKKKIQTIMDKMHADAVAVGNQIIDSEKQLNALFKQGTINQQQLDSLVFEIATLQGKLRTIHLSAHLKTREILSEAQVTKYNQLMNYTRGT